MIRIVCNILVIISIGFINACTLYRPATAPIIAIPRNFIEDVHVSHPEIQCDWWKNFSDPALNELVAIALKNNNLYLAALKNIDVAETYVSQNFSKLFPLVNANYQLSRNRFVGALASGSNIFAGPNRIFTLSQIYGIATYELNIWNKIGNSIKQAQSDVSVAVANSNTVRLTLLSSVVNTYFQIEALNANILNLEKQYQATKKIVALLSIQFQSGLIDISPLDTAKNQMESIKTNLQSSIEKRKVLMYLLAYLLGEYPENHCFSVPHNLPNFQYAKLVPGKLPAKIIADRPDVQSSFFQVLSYGYLEKQNIANFLPSFNLDAVYGYLGTTLAGFSGKFWSYGLTLVQTLFDYKRNISIYRRSKYQYQAAVLQYRDTIFNAFKEVESALASYKADMDILNNDRTIYQNQNEILSAARAQYHSGLIDYATYLNKYLAALQAQYTMTNQRLAVIMDVIQVYKSLGLGAGVTQYK